MSLCIHEEPPDATIDPVSADHYSNELYSRAYTSACAGVCECTAPNIQDQIKNAPRRKQTTSQQEFEDWQFQEKQAYLQQQQQHHQYDNLEPHFHTEEEHQAPVLQFQNNQTSLPHLALENQFQWRI